MTIMNHLINEMDEVMVWEMFGGNRGNYGEMVDVIMGVVNASTANALAANPPTANLTTTNLSTTNPSTTNPTTANPPRTEIEIMVVMMEMIM